MEKKEIVQAVKARGSSPPGADSFYTPAIAIVADPQAEAEDGFVNLETWHFNGDPRNPVMKTMKVPDKSYGDDMALRELVAMEFLGKNYRDPSNTKCIEVYR
jgi:hypothetical protein